MTTEQTNGTDNLELQLPDLVGKLTGWKDRASKAQIAASGITVVTNDEEDAKCAAMIVKLRNTLDGWTKPDGVFLEGISAARMEVTRKLDAAKKLLMEPEKIVTEQVERLKTLRNTYANKKLADAKKANAEAERLKNLENNKIEYRKKIRDVFANKQVDAINAMNNGIKAYVDTITLENWDEKIKRFDITPQLKEPVYQEMKKLIPSLIGGLTDGDCQAIRDEEEFSFNNQNLEYQRIAAKIVQDWRDSLPTIKEKLMDIKKLVDMGANGGADMAKQGLWGAVNDAAGKAERELLTTAQEKRDENEQKAQGEQLNTEVQAQVIAQTAAEPGGRRVLKAKVVCENKDLAKVWSNIIFQLLLKNSPSYQFKEGTQEYATWSQALLNDFAKLPPEIIAKVPGVIIEETVSTITRK